MRRALLLAPLALLAALAAGCGGTISGPAASAPSARQLGSQSLAALTSQRSAHFAIDAKLDVRSSGAVASPVLRFLLSKPVELVLEGDASRTSLTAGGTATVGGQRFDAELRAGSHALYLNVLGTWFGTRAFGLGDVGRGIDVGALTRTLRSHAGDVLTGKVQAGPMLDGTATWEFDGKLNADGLAKLYEKLEGEALSAQERSQLQTLADATRVVADTGRDDNLLRRLVVGLDLSKNDLQALDPSGHDVEGIDSVRFDLTVDLTDWGKQVTVSPPSSYSPLRDLLTILLGRLLGP